MRIIHTILFLGLVFFGASFAKANCSCEKFSPLSFNVGSDPILFAETKVSKIQGIAVDALNKPPSKVYVFLFRKPSNITDENFTPFDLKQEEVVSACETKKDGKFCFENISRGKYVVCAYTPYDSSFISKTTCAIVSLKPNNLFLKGKIKLTLEVPI